ncbi:MAG: biosynthetic peptidoglycan transglycosylase [Polyangiaceae bacterium]
MRLPSRSKLWGITGASILGASALGFWGGPRIAGSMLERRARDRGLSVSYGRAWLDFAGVNLGAVRLEIPASDLLSAELPRVTVPWSALLGQSRLEIHGGVVSMRGDPNELRDRIQTTKREPSSHSTHSATPIHVEGLVIHWSGAKSNSPQCHGSGITVIREGSALDVRAQSLRCHDEHAQIEARALAVSIGEEAAKGEHAGSGSASSDDVRSKQHPWRVHLDEVQFTVGDLSPIGAPTSKTVGEVATKAANQTSTSTATRDVPIANEPGKTGVSKRAHEKIDSTERPRDATLLPNSGKSPSTTNSNPLAPARDALRELRELLTLGRDEYRKALSSVPVGSFVRSDRIYLRISKDGQKLDLGPFTLAATRDASTLTFELRQGAAQSQIAFVANATMFTDERRAKTSLAIGPTTLDRLGISAGDFGLEDVTRTSIRISANANLDSANSDVVLESDGELSNLAFRQPWLAKGNISGLNLTWQGRVNFDPNAGRLRLQGMRLGLGRVSARIDATLAFLESSRQIEGTFEVPLAACQDFFDALPSGLAPLLGRWRVDETFGLSSRVAYRSDAAEKSVVKLRLDNRCRVASVPPEVSPTRFQAPFSLEVEDATGTPATISFGPGTWTWTPLQEISPYVESAVLVCEDGRFLRHSGFDLEAIENSIKDNLRSGRFARGGSTVSMQLAKNLYLRRDRTLSRKLQEAALTMLLEQSFSKRQLLEISLNVIEYGPGIYGIGPAARHYFDTTPDRLSLAQSFFLISLLPNPKVTRFGADGRLFQGWLRQIRSLMTIAAKRGHFSAAELEAGLLEEPAFRQPGPPPSVHPTRRITGDLDGPTDDNLDGTVREIENDGP